MPLNIPTAQEIFNRKAADVINEIGDLDPFLRGSLIRAILVADSNTASELYATLEQLQQLTFWDTTTGTELERWASIFGITRNAAKIATGNVTFTGIDTTLIPTLTEFTSAAGNNYTSTVSVNITANVLSVTTLTRVSSVVTATTSIDHDLASNVDVTIAGALEPEYNGTFTIVVTDTNEFTYTISTTPSSPATGTITAAATYASVNVQSTDFGASNNLLPGESLSLSTPIAGVDNVGFVGFIGVDGGTDEETDENLRDRFLFRVQNPVANFNENAIINQAREVAGVTRVFVQSPNDLNVVIAVTSITRFDVFAKVVTTSPHGLNDGQIVTIAGAVQIEYNLTNAMILVIDSSTFGYIVTGSPVSPATGTITSASAIAVPGQVRILFVRDNDTPIIPSAQEVADVKAKVLDIKPAPIQDNDVIVLAPTGSTVPFTFTELTPNTASMQTAISANLQSYFSTGTSVDQDIKEIDYQSVINSTIDSGGNTVSTFTLSAPTGDIVIGVSEIALLGTITYP